MSSPAIFVAVYNNEEGVSWFRCPYFCSENLSITFTQSGVYAVLKSDVVDKDISFSRVVREVKKLLDEFGVQYSWVSDHYRFGSTMWGDQACNAFHIEIGLTGPLPYSARAYLSGKPGECPSGVHVRYGG